MLEHDNGLVYDKTFDACLIEGPAFLKLGDNNVLLYCSVPNNIALHLLEVREGSPALGSIMLVNTKFSACYFSDTITFVGTPADIALLKKAINTMDRKDWQEKHFGKN